MMQSLSKALVWIRDSHSNLGSVQFAKVWAAVVAMLLIVLFSVFPAVAVFTMQFVLAIVFFVSLATFVVSKVFGKVERLEYITNLYTKLGTMLDKVYATKEKEDVLEHEQLNLDERSCGSIGTAEPTRQEAQPSTTKP